MADVGDKIAESAKCSRFLDDSDITLIKKIAENAQRRIELLKRGKKLDSWNNHLDSLRIHAGYVYLQKHSRTRQLVNLKIYLAKNSEILLDLPGVYVAADCVKLMIKRSESVNIKLAVHNMARKNSASSKMKEAIIELTVVEG